MARTLLKINDREKMHDKCSSLVKPEGPFIRKGFVQIIDKDTGEFLVKHAPCEFGGTGTSNLIVWQGREIVPQILFEKDRNLNSLQKDLRLRWLSVGSGGADAVNVLSPIAPDSPDFALNQEIIIDAGEINYADGGKKKYFDSVDFEQDSENDNRFLIGKATTTLKYDEANGYDLNEAGIWLSNSSDPNAAVTFELFARVTFSTIRKDDQRELVILWYFYF